MRRVLQVAPPRLSATTETNRILLNRRESLGGVFGSSLPGYSIILIQLRWHIHDGGITGFVVLLPVLYVAFLTALIHTWRPTRYFPVRGGIAFVISLLLLPQVIHFMLTTS